MNIKKTLICIVTVVSTAVIIAQDATTATGNKPRKRRGPHSRSRSELLIAPAQGPRVKVVDMQKRVSQDVIKSMQANWRSMTWLHSDLITDGTRETVFSDGNSGLAIFIVDKPGGETLLVSPEGCWVELNVAPLAADNPTKELLDKRVRREMWRALAYGMGVGNEQMGSLLAPITSVKALDEYDSDTPTPDAFNQIVFWAARRKMARVRYSTYRRACEEGWAPAPTNDAQKAVWEQVKSDKERGPTKPITIEPPGKKK